MSDADNLIKETEQVAAALDGGTAQVAAGTTWLWTHRAMAGRGSVSAAAAVRWNTSVVVAEANNGGMMVQSVLNAADLGLFVRLVHASKGKSARAEPIALKFETGKAYFAGEFPELEAELDRVLDREGVRHGQRAGMREADRARAGVGRGAELRPAAAEHLGDGRELGVDLEPDDHLVGVAHAASSGFRSPHRVAPS